MGKRNLSAAGYDAIMLGTMALSGVTAAQNIDNPYLATFSAAIGLGATYHLIANNATPSNRGRKSRFAYLTEMYGMTITEKGEGEGKHYEAKWKDRPVREFVFRDEKLLKYPVPESTLADVVRAGKRREMNARYGSRINMYETTGKQYRRLKIHEAWSAVWFTKTRRNRVLRETFDDCLTILIVTGYLHPPSAGTSARLIDPRPTANQIVDGVREWWQYLHAPSPSVRGSVLRLIPLRAA